MSKKLLVRFVGVPLVPILLVSALCWLRTFLMHPFGIKMHLGQMYYQVNGGGERIKQIKCHFCMSYAAI